MAWFELHEQFAGHPKIARLAKALNIPKVQARGHVVTLWCWTVSYAQDGSFSAFSDSDIADAAEWEDDASAFVKALIASGWLNEDRQLHDWTDHGVRLLRQMRERQQKHRECDKKELSRDDNVTVTPPSRPTDLTDHTDLSDPPEKLVVDAPRRDHAKNLRELKNLDFVLRCHKDEFAGWVDSVKRMIQEENKGRPKNPFAWRAGTGSFESDMTGLMYRIGDEKKQEILYAAFNVLNEKVNWPNYVTLAIRYTIRASEKAKIAAPYQFTIAVMQKPHQIVSAKSDGILSGLVNHVRPGAP
jgi:hypothetical protein